LLYLSSSIVLFVAKSIIARTELSAQMIASLNLFIIDGISGSVSRVVIIYIGILHCLFLLSTMAKVGETSKRKLKFSENVRIKFPFFFSEERNENEAKCNICDCFVNF
jgi:hypothetical protein